MEWIATQRNSTDTTQQRHSGSQCSAANQTAQRIATHRNATQHSRQQCNATQQTQHNRTHPNTTKQEIKTTLICLTN